MATRLSLKETQNLSNKDPWLSVPVLRLVWLCRNLYQNTKECNFCSGKKLN